MSTFTEKFFIFRTIKFDSLPDQLQALYENNEISHMNYYDHDTYISYNYHWLQLYFSHQCQLRIHADCIYTNINFPLNFGPSIPRIMIIAILGRDQVLMIITNTISIYYY